MLLTVSPMGPWRITFVTNPDDCNLRCVMCRRSAPDYRSGRSRRMDFRLVEKVFEERPVLQFTEIIPSTLGEPLLYPEMDRMIDLCARTGVRMNLTTNGTFPGRGARAWAERLVPVISDIKVSWNGADAATAEELMPGLCFEAAIQSVRDFIAVRDDWVAQGAERCQVSFQITANELNVDQIPEIVELASRLGVDRIKVNQLQLYFDRLEPLSLQRGRGGALRWATAVKRAHQTVERILREGRQPPRLQNFVPFVPSRSTPAPERCPFLGREAWISWDGRFSPCPAPRAASGALGEFGSLRERSLAHIWDGEQMRSLLQRRFSHDECKACRMRHPGGI